MRMYPEMSQADPLW